MRCGHFGNVVSLPKQIVLGRFVHRAASNVEHLNDVSFDCKEDSEPPNTFTVEQLVDLLIDQVAFWCQRSGASE